MTTLLPNIRHYSESGEISAIAMPAGFLIRGWVWVPTRLLDAIRAAPA